MAELTLSGGGKDAALAHLRMDGKDFAIQWPGTLPTPVLSANKATYPEVMPGVDLVMIAERSGYQQHLVIKSADAARNPALASVRFGVNAPGLKLSSDKGTLRALDDKGAEVFTSPKSTMWDSTVKSAPVGVSFVDGSLVVVPDRKFLADPAMVYPVTVDPPWSPPAKHGWATVLSGLSNDKYWWTSGEHPWAQVGQCPRDLPDSDCRGIGEAWAYFQYDTTFLADKPLIEATLDTSVVYSPNRRLRQRRGILPVDPRRPAGRGSGQGPEGCAKAGKEIEAFDDLVEDPYRPKGTGRVDLYIRPGEVHVGDVYGNVVMEHGSIPGNLYGKVLMTNRGSLVTGFVSGDLVQVGHHNIVGAYGPDGANVVLKDAPRMRVVQAGRIFGGVSW